MRVLLEEGVGAVEHGGGPLVGQGQGLLLVAQSTAEAGSRGEGAGPGDRRGLCSRCCARTTRWRARRRTAGSQRWARTSVPELAGCRRSSARRSGGGGAAGGGPPPLQAGEASKLGAFLAGGQLVDLADASGRRDLDDEAAGAGVGRVCGAGAAYLHVGAAHAGAGGARGGGGGGGCGLHDGAGFSLKSELTFWKKKVLPTVAIVKRRKAK